MTHRPAWHALLAPLPADAAPIRRPVAPPEVLSTLAGSSIAGWEQIVVHLSDPNRGLRIVVVVVDASGMPVSASDGIFLRIDGDPPEVRHESLGGRFEPDGRFLGTHWLSVGPDPGDDVGAPPPLHSTPSAPTPDQVAGLRALVADLLRRQPRRS